MLTFPWRSCWTQLPTLNIMMITSDIIKHQSKRQRNYTLKYCILVKIIYKQFNPFNTKVWKYSCALIAVVWHRTWCFSKASISTKCQSKWCLSQQYPVFYMKKLDYCINKTHNYWEKMKKSSDIFVSGSSFDLSWSKRSRSNLIRRSLSSQLEAYGFSGWTFWRM